MKSVTASLVAVALALSAAVPAFAQAPAAAKPQTPVQRQFGEISPKFAELTDDVSATSGNGRGCRSGTAAWSP